MTRPSGSAADSHEPFEQLAVGHVLSALEPEEQERFAAHLAACARCERAVAEHAETLAHLGRAVPQVDPPPSLLAGIRAGVEQAPRAAAPPRTLSPPATLDEHRARRSVQVRRSHLLISAAAVAAVLLGLGGWNAVLQRDNASQEAQVESLASAVEALEAEDTRTARLTSPEGEVLAVAVLEDDEMSLVVDGLAPTDADSVYVLWGQSWSGEVRAVGAFDVEDQGLEVLDGMPLEPEMSEVTTLMVTREPGRVAPPASSQQPVVSGDVQGT